MIKIINIDNAEKSEILTRDIKLESGVEAIVADIIKNVRENGDKALKEYSLKFDGADIKNLRVTQEEIDSAYENEDKALIETLEMAKANIWNFHEKQLRKGFEINNGDGTVSGQKITPIEKVGIYVPGGTASYPSTVLMNAIPAKIAGVSEII
ncbi:MAG: histidinol dehydrogenase, partial [Clostridia bacterium]|nr:histidinol dehydrogenase [Clostridia bacterium]